MVHGNAYYTRHGACAGACTWEPEPSFVRPSGRKRRYGSAATAHKRLGPALGGGGCPCRNLIHSFNFAKVFVISITRAPIRL
eukprot:3079642-Prymnesium_polylepis.1